MCKKIVIREYPVSGPIVVAGIEFADMTEIQRITNINVPAKEAGRAKNFQPVVFNCRKYPEYRDGWCAALIYERYPCFDAMDYATEDRFYNNYVFHKGEITPQLCKKFLQNIPQGNDTNMATANAPIEYLPILFHDDGEDFVTVAELE